MTASAPGPRGGAGSRYTPPRAGDEPVPGRQRPTAVRVVAALVILAMVLAPLAFLFAL
jgi:hypothetical protein